MKLTFSAVMSSAGASSTPPRFASSSSSSTTSSTAGGAIYVYDETRQQFEQRATYGVPSTGTSAHSFTLLHDQEADAFRALAVDYILTKPTHMDTLLAVLHAISARAV